jgi:hypothetical protein
MAYFEHLDHQGGFYYEVGPSPSLPNVNKILLLRLPKNSAGAMRPFTRSLRHFLRAGTASTSSARSGMNIGRTHIVQLVTSGRAAGVHATPCAPWVWIRLIACGVTDAFVRV